MFMKMPREAFALGMLEICSSTALIFWFFLPLMQLPFARDSLWGYVFFGALLLTGFCSGLGVFLRWRWSWTMVLAKSALIISMSLFLLDYVFEPEALIQSRFVAFSYLAFVIAEICTVILALRQPLKDYLGIRSWNKLPIRDLISSALCISSGILLILLESAIRFPAALDVSAPPEPVSTVFASMSDTSILCGLLIIVGGVLILLRSNILGAATSMIFGFFPPNLQIGSIPSWLPQQCTYHASDFIWNITLPWSFSLIAIAVGSLPIIGGLLALAGKRRSRT